MTWIKLTMDNTNGTPILINMSNATDVVRHEGQNRTVICFVSGSADEQPHVVVKETPEFITGLLGSHLIN